MKVILINGKSGVGKDTVARILKEKIMSINGESVVILPNALEVKRVASQVYNWDGKKDLKGRRLLIDITTTGYNYDKYFWEKKSLKIVNDSYVKIDYLIVPDWRYLSTFQFWTKNAEKVLTMRKLGGDRYGYTKDITKDESEIALDDFKCDMQIQNFEDLDDLEYDVEGKARVIQRVE